MSVEAMILGAAALCLVLAALWLLGRHGDDGGGGGGGGSGGPTGGRGRGGSEGGRQQLE